MKKSNSFEKQEKTTQQKGKYKKIHNKKKDTYDVANLLSMLSCFFI